MAEGGEEAVGFGCRMLAAVRERVGGKVKDGHDVGSFG